MNIFTNEVNRNDYIVATYFLESTENLKDAAWNIAIGQSVGNPSVRNEWETDRLYDDHACKVLTEEWKLEASKRGVVEIAFPIVNIDWAEDGISQLLCMLMGGQMDIDTITRCHLNRIEVPHHMHLFNPKYGIQGIKEFTGVTTKPLLGGIVKPKTGIDVDTLLDMVKQMCDGGVNFIKEDEIMANPPCAPIAKRIDVISDYINNHHPDVIYAYCINSDAPYFLERAAQVHQYGGDCVHLNFWAGLGAYKSIREMDLPIFLFFQKSGDKILTNPRHNFHIKWNVICQLAGMMGVDFIHAGMWGGYSNTSETSLQSTMNVLHSYDVMPSLSCGMHPGIVNKTTRMFGFNYMANVGGAIHGHPGGTYAGAKAMRQAIDGELSGKEYLQAIDKWGIIE